jgi:soluble lytic murein transglycosylase
MQISDITKEWAKEELNLGEINIFDPETNIKIGCWYLSKLYKEFGRLDLVIAAYNGGSGNVRKWLNNYTYSKDGKSLDLIPFEETSTYVKKITKNYKMYNKLYSKEG